MSSSGLSARFGARRHSCTVWMARNNCVASPTAHPRMDGRMDLLVECLGLAVGRPPPNLSTWYLLRLPPHMAHPHQTLHELRTFSPAPSKHLRTCLSPKQSVSLPLTHAWLPPSSTRLSRSRWHSLPGCGAIVPSCHALPCRLCSPSRLLSPMRRLATMAAVVLCRLVRRCRLRRPLACEGMLA